MPWQVNGRSEKPMHFDGSIGAYNAFLQAFIAQQGWDRFNVVVEDWGGLALVTAQELHDRVGRRERDTRSGVSLLLCHHGRVYGLGGYSDVVIGASLLTSWSVEPASLVTTVVLAFAYGRRAHL